MVLFLLGVILVGAALADILVMAKFSVSIAILFIGGLLFLVGFHQLRHGGRRLALQSNAEVDEEDDF